MSPILPHSFSLLALTAFSSLGCGEASLGLNPDRNLSTPANCLELPPQPHITGGYFQDGAAHILFRPVFHPNLATYILYRTDRSCARVNAGDFHTNSLQPVLGATITQGLEEGELQFNDFTFHRGLWFCYTIETETLCPQPHPIRMHTYWNLGVP